MHIAEYFPNRKDTQQYNNHLKHELLLYPTELTKSILLHPKNMIVNSMSNYILANFYKNQNLDFAWL